MLPEFAVELLNKEFRGRAITFDPHDWFGGAALGVGVSWDNKDDPSSASVEVRITAASDFPGEGVILHLHEVDSGYLLGEAEIQRELVHHEDDKKTYALKARFQNIPSSAVCSMKAAYT